MKLTVVLLITVGVALPDLVYQPYQNGAYDFLKQPNQSICPIYTKLPAFKLDKKLVSRQKVRLGEVPWQVILSKKPNRGFFCGGSIIAPEWVLTAAHCTNGRKSINISFGSIRIKDNAPVSMTSEIFVQHPEYDPDTLHNDIALIKLPMPLTFSDTINSINLVPGCQGTTLPPWIFDPNIVYTSGFGITSDEFLDYSNDLLYAFLEVVPNKVCTDRYGYNAMTSSGICAIGAYGSNQNICSGDSGGALISSHYGLNIQIGINSYAAINSCTEFYPAGFTRIASFMDFISEETDIDFYTFPSDCKLS